MQKRMIMTLMAAMLMVALATGSAWAHSTKGRIKIQLTKESVTVDDMAYFIEYYVHKVKYAEKYENIKNRFYLKEFERIEQDGESAEVFFTVHDFRKDVSFDDSVKFIRDKDHAWSYIRENGEVGEPIYTYVKKTDYYGEKYVFPVAGVGLVLALGAFVFLRFKRKGKEEA